MRAILVAAALCLVGLFATGVAQAATPAAITCGSTVRADAVLTADLDCSDGRGITLAPGVFLNLATHSITGPGGGSPTGAVGVTFSASAGSGMYNGQIRDWPIGALQTHSGPVYSSVLQYVNFLHDGTGLMGSPLAAVMSYATASNNIRGLYGHGAELAIYRSTFTSNHFGAVLDDGARLSVASSAFNLNRYAIFCTASSLTVTSTTFISNGTAQFSSGCAPASPTATSR